MIDSASKSIYTTVEGIFCTSNDRQRVQSPSIQLWRGSSAPPMIDSTSKSIYTTGGGGGGGRETSACPMIDNASKSIYTTVEGGSKAKGAPRSSLLLTNWPQTWKVKSKYFTHPSQDNSARGVSKRWIFKRPVNRIPTAGRGMSEQLLVRLTKQNSSREMYSSMRRHV